MCHNSKVQTECCDFMVRPWLNLTNRSMECLTLARTPDTQGSKIALFGVLVCNASALSSLKPSRGHYFSPAQIKLNVFLLFYIFEALIWRYLRLVCWRKKKKRKRKWKRNKPKYMVRKGRFSTFFIDYPMLKENSPFFFFFWGKC